MPKRFVAIWFPFLVSDWMVRQKPELKGVPFILYASERGRMVVKAASRTARAKGIAPEMVVADCRAIFPDLTVLEYPSGKDEQLLLALAAWCIRFTPIAAIDRPDGIVLDCTGCTHLWGGEAGYIATILDRFTHFGYHARAVVSDTIAASWALSRFDRNQTVVPPGKQLDALLDLPPAALRLEPSTTERLEKLGLSTIRHFAHMPRPALRKRFGAGLLSRLDQATGFEPELLQPVQPPKLHQERLPCLEPIRTAKGIEIAIERLLEELCAQLEAEGLGLRTAVLRCHRVDGDIQVIDIGTNLPSRNVRHLMKLFELKIVQLRPDLGFELFELHAPKVEDIAFDQSMLWNTAGTHDTAAVAELLDKIVSKRGGNVVHRYLPAEHYWPERSYKLADSIDAQPETGWRTDLQRPIHLLRRPERIEVTVPLPDYPPMLFRYRGKVHHIKKADGPERIEQEWWLQQGVFRDYYCVEDEQGGRYWLFRSGHYGGGMPSWFIHGFFA